jgi:SAM-dependent methyltransferase
VKSQVDSAISEVLFLIPQLIEFNNSPPEQRQSFHDRTKDPLGNYEYFCGLRERLLNSGVVVEDVAVDVAAFRTWLKQYPEIESSYRNLGDAHIEKCLEHYLSYTYLRLSPGDIFVDVAAAGSPYAGLLRRRMNIESYRLDLAYPKGIQGNNIGADAGNTGLPDGFASTLALHCAFECFMGEADANFVYEASRILKPGGRYLIVPLYLDETYFISTSPYCNQENVVIDSGALKVWRDDSHKAPFSRHYSPEVFFERIYSRIPHDMEGVVYFLKNLPEVMAQYEGQRIYCYFMFHCKKK